MRPRITSFICASVVLMLLGTALIAVTYKGNLNTYQNPMIVNQSKAGIHCERRRLILLWTEYYRPIMRNSLINITKENCCCTITSDRRKIDSAEAVVFHIHDFKKSDLPRTRNPHQYYVFFSKESAQRTAHRIIAPKLRNFFNLTMTYRSKKYRVLAFMRDLSEAIRTFISKKLAKEHFKVCNGNIGDSLRRVFRHDSDVHCPYGEILERERSNIAGAPLSWKNISSKRKLVAWYVSNCWTPSKREKYVKELKKYIPVDQFGQCNGRSCGKTKDECNDRLTKDYKFYLSFENSICEDYVTEKFFTRAQRSVPVVLTRRTHERALNQQASSYRGAEYISADDFKTPKELANFLVYLDKNASAYMKYWEYQRDHAVLFETPYQCGCTLCEALDSLNGRPKIISDILPWWMRGCRRRK